MAIMALMMAKATPRLTALASHGPPAAAMKAASGVSAPRTAFRSAAPSMAARIGANSATTALPSDGVQPALGMQQAQRHQRAKRRQLDQQEDAGDHRVDPHVQDRDHGDDG